MSENPSKNQCQEKRERCEFLNIIAWLTLILQSNRAEPSVSPISFNIETVTFCWDAPAGPLWLSRKVRCGPNYVVKKQSRIPWSWSFSRLSASGAGTTSATIRRDMWWSASSAGWALSCHIPGSEPCHAWTRAKSNVWCRQRIATRANMGS